MYGLLILVMVMAPLFAETTVNKSIHIRSDERRSDGCNTVNGSITLDDGVRVSGGCKSVNGSIRIGDDCVVRRVSTVNGAIRLGRDNTVGSDIESVNGSISCQTGTIVDDGIETVNGSIEIDGTTVEDDITTYNGSISLSNRSEVGDNIIVKRNRGHNNRRKPLYITIDRSTVHGDVINYEDDIEVIVILRDGGEVRGDIVNAIVKRER